MRLIAPLTAAQALVSWVAADHLSGLPSVPFTSTGGTPLRASGLERIIVDATFAQSRDNDGETLIPPSLEEFANTFAQDLETLDLHLSVEIGSRPSPHSIFLTLGESAQDHNEADRTSSEGYTLDVTSDGVTVSGASPLGVWWGSRTVLQQIVLTNGSLSQGHGVDSPGWRTRGLMLDIARHYYPPEFLVEMCSYMSFFKQNTFHLHLSDNLFNNVDIYTHERSLDLYAAFRLLTDDPAVAGLNKRANESYTRDVFDDVQRKCAARGVTVLPEIEAPGHALVITQWKPELGLESDLSLLNITHPDTIPTMQTIWKTFLPWFHSKTVSIGADEYVDASLNQSTLVGEYKRFVDEMNDFITSTSDKKVRIWSTFPPAQGAGVNKSISIQHWANFEANPYWDFVKEGYDVMNSGDYTYIVGKWSQSYPQSLNQTFLFHGSPNGSAFSPNIFDRDNATNNAPEDSTALMGHISAQWNDYGPNATTILEAYYQWREGLGALADKQWGGQVTELEYPSLHSSLQPWAPGQNLDRRIPSKTPTIVDYDFTSRALSRGTVKDKSGNSYDAQTNCSGAHEGILLEHPCKVTTPLSQKGRNYTMSFSIKPTSHATGPLFTAGDSGLYSGNGTVSSVMLISGGNAYALNYTFPVGQWTHASLFTKGRQTFLDVGKGTPMEFQAILGWNGDAFVWAPIAVEAPLATIGGGGFEGYIQSMKLIDNN